MALAVPLKVTQADPSHKYRSQATLSQKEKPEKFKEGEEDDDDDDDDEEPRLATNKKTLT